MIKDIERFLYHIVKVELLNDNKLYIGYLVRNHIFDIRYEILPLDLREKRIAICKSHIKKIEFFSEQNK